MNVCVVTHEEKVLLQVKYAILPPSGVLDVIVAAGPVPALFTALTLKVYEVKGLKLGISKEVVWASSTVILSGGSGPST